MEMEIEMNPRGYSSQETLDGLIKKSWWRRKSFFEKKLIVSLIIIGTLLFISLIYIAATPKSKTNWCSTPECLIAVSNIVNHVDPKINPCENFFDFTCRKTIEEEDRSTYTHHVKKMNKLENEIIRKMIKITTDDDQHHLLKEQKVFFQDCMNESFTQKDESLETFKETLKEINGWPVIEGANWNEKEFNWTKAILVLRQKGYYESVSPLFYVHLNLDPAELYTYILNIEPTYLYTWERTTIVPFMIETAETFGANRSEAEKDMNDVFDFTQKLISITKLLYNIETGFVPNRRCTIEDYQKEYNNFHWLEFINSYLDPVVNLSEKDYVLFAGKNVLKSVIHLANSTPARVISNYIIWTLVESTMEFFPTEYEALQQKYVCLHGFTSKRADTCENLIMKSPVIHIEYLRKYFTEDHKKEFKKMFGILKSEFTSMLSENTWMTAENKKAVIKSISNLSLVLGQVKNISDDLIYNIIHGLKKDNQFLNTSFFISYLNHKKLLADLHFYCLNPNSSQLNFLQFYFNNLQTDIYSKEEENLIVIPAGALQDINYNSKRPMYLNYGSFGRMMGYIVAKSFTNLRTESKDDEFWSNETIKAYENMISCIDEENLQLDSSFSTYMTEYVKQKTIAQQVGFQMAYRAYKKWVKTHGEEQQLFGIDYTHSQLFWISALMPECYDENFNDGRGYRINMLRDNAAIKNIPNFADDFNCPANSKMNPLNKCQLF